MRTCRSAAGPARIVRFLSIWANSLALFLVALTTANASSPVSISDGGTPSYSSPIAVPPGIAGMTPNISLLYTGSSINGPVGYGWTLQGVSMITRCAGSKVSDGYVPMVQYGPNDKLCLDSFAPQHAGGQFYDGFHSVSQLLSHVWSDTMPSADIQSNITSREAILIRAYNSNCGGCISNMPAPPAMARTVFGKNGP